MGRIRQFFSEVLAAGSRALKTGPYSPSSDETAGAVFGIPASSSGIQVTETTALSLITYLACIRNIADDTSKLSMAVLRTKPDGSKEVLPDHDVANLMNVEPNPDATPRTFRGTLMAHAVGWGNGWAEIQWRGNGRPYAAWNILPEDMKVRRKFGVLTYTARGLPIDRENLLHVAGPSFNGLLGYSPARAAAEGLGNAIAAERMAGKFFGSGARPSGVLKYPKALDDKKYARLKESFQEEHTGENAVRPILLEDGMDWTSISIPPEDAQFLETRNFGVIEICRLLRMPPHKVAQLDRATFSNIEHQAIEYVVDCLQTWSTAFEQEIRRKLLGPGNLSARHNFATLLRGDLKSRYEAHKISREGGWASANDILRLEDKDPIGPAGDVYIVPVNMQNQERLLVLETTPPAAPGNPQPPAPTPEPKADDKPPAPAPDPKQERASKAQTLLASWVPAWTAEFAALHKTEADKATRAKERNEFAATASKLLQTHGAFVEAKLGPLAEIAAVSLATIAEQTDATAARAAGRRAAAHVARDYVAALESTGVEGWITRPHDPTKLHTPEVWAQRLSQRVLAELS